MIIPAVHADIAIREGFEDWNVNEWDTTETFTGVITVSTNTGNEGIYGLNCSAVTTVSGAQAFINYTAAQFSGSNSYVGFDIRVVESKINMGMDCEVATFGNTDGTFGYLDINDNSTDYTWEFNNVDTNETIIFDSWNFFVIGVQNTTEGWAALWLNDVLLMNITADYSTYDLCNEVSVGLVEQLVNKGCEVWLDEVIISGEYPVVPFEANFWFIVTGVITFGAITFYALIIVKGKK